VRIGRREVIAATVLTGAVLASPAIACRSPRAKDRDGYRAAVDALFSAWWARDYDAFHRRFQHSEVPDPFDSRPLFDAHFAAREQRFRGPMLFNGASVIAQVVTPRSPDGEHGICGGHASADLFLVKFYPGLEEIVIDKVDHVDRGVLAQSEWNRMRRASR
jgi:hypothetical protein